MTKREIQFTNLFLDIWVMLQKDADIRNAFVLM